jgi:hypothetical protein
MRLLASSFVCCCGLSVRAQGVPGTDPATAPSGSLNIEHEPPACMLAEAYPELEARIEAEEPPKATLRFRARGESRWYGVPMFSREGRFTAVLPKPKASAKGVEYSIEAAGRLAGQAKTQVFDVPVIEGADACGGKRIAALAASPGQIGVEVPDGTRSLPPGFSEKNVVGNYVSGKPVKGHPRTALFAVLGAGAGAVGLAQITGKKAVPDAGEAQDVSLLLTSSSPPPGSTVSLKNGAMSVTLEALIDRDAPPGASVSLKMYVDFVVGGPGCLTLTGVAAQGIPKFTATQLTVTTPFQAVSSACGSSFDAAFAGIVIQGPGGVYAQTGATAGTLPAVEVDYHFVP